MLKSVNGDRVAEFRLACKSRRKEGDTWVDGHTNWFSIEAWGRFADHVGASLRRGDVVMVLGRLKVDQWEAGDKRGTSIKIRAEHIGHSLRLGPALRQRTAKPAPDADAVDDHVRTGHGDADNHSMSDASSGETEVFAGADAFAQSTSEPQAAWLPPGGSSFGA